MTTGMAIHSVRCSSSMSYTSVHINKDGNSDQSSFPEKQIVYIPAYILCAHDPVV